MDTHLMIGVAVMLGLIGIAASRDLLRRLREQQPQLVPIKVERPDLGPLLLLREPPHRDRGALVAQLLGDLRPGEAVQDVAPLVLDDGHLDAINGDVRLQTGVGLGIERGEQSILGQVPALLGSWHES